MFRRILALFIAVSLILNCGLFKRNNHDYSFSGREKIMRRDDNFTALALDYLEVIAEKYSDRGDLNITSEKRACRAWIIEELIKAGYDKSQITEQSIKTGGITTGKNIIVSIEGKSKKQIIVGAHYDGDGIGDNGSGLALLLATAVGFADRKLPYSVRYVFFDNEEIGLFGADYYAKNMSKTEIENTFFMINMDSLAFGDYCNIYGGVSDLNTGKVSGTAAYQMAMKRAEKLGFHTWNTSKLDGYYAKNGHGPALDPIGLFTNPWTAKNPAPQNSVAYSPAQCANVSDHQAFVDKGIEYIYFEATNWYAMGKKPNSDSYTGYFETTDTSVGKNGMFMNTKYDTYENLNTLYPGRIVEHFNIYSILLSSLITNPIDK